MATNMTDISWGGLILKFKLENFPFLIKIYLFRASNFSKMLHNPENPLIIKWNLFILSSSLPNFNQDVSARPGRQMSTPCRNQGGTFCKNKCFEQKKTGKKGFFWHYLIKFHQSIMFIIDFYIYSKHRIPAFLPHFLQNIFHPCSL